MMDPEYIHDKITSLGALLGDYRVGKKITEGFFGYENKILEQKILGMDFKNPIGLSAGFDKNAQLTDILSSVGFGFAEVGSITGNFCEGNPKPRLWRLKESRGLLVYYGLKNDGCEAIADRLNKKLADISSKRLNRIGEYKEEISRKNGIFFPIGINIAMTNCKDNFIINNAVKDFAKSFRVMEPFGSYMTINISCPNTEGGQPFIIPQNLVYLLDTIDKIPTTKPIFIKLSPDLSLMELDRLLDIVLFHRIHGIICTNLTKKRDNSRIVDNHVPAVGGMSGKIVQDLSDKMMSHIYKRVGGKLILIGSGGVFSAEDAYKKIRLGASLVQMITGMIFEGPQVVSEINQGLVQLLKKDGFTNISQVVGVDCPI